MNAPKPFGTNYVESEQNSEKWLNERKFKITCTTWVLWQKIFFEVKIHPLL